MMGMKLFVYGTLRRGMENHSYLQGARLISSKAWVEGILYDTGNGYPVLIQGNGRVYGEIYHVNQEHIRQIDLLEEFYAPKYPQNLYERIECFVDSPEGKHHTYIYVYNQESGLEPMIHHIKSGDWCKYLRLSR